MAFKRSFQDFQGQSLNLSTSPYAAEHSSALQQQIPGEPIDPGNEVGVEGEKLKARGRGYTGNPRGRPPGSKNKPKVPDDGLPKLPKKKGRPPGAKNKNPKGAQGKVVPKATPRVVSPNKKQKLSAKLPRMAVEAVEAPAPPTMGPHEISIPDGYAQVTDSKGQLGNNAGAQHAPATLGGGDNFDYTLANNVLRQYLKPSPPAPVGFLTNSDPGHPGPTSSPYASQGNQAPAARVDGSQYPEPPQSGADIFTFGRGDGCNFTYDIVAANINGLDKPSNSTQGNEAAKGNGYNAPPSQGLVSAYDPVLAPEPSPESCIDPALLGR